MGIPRIRFSLRAMFLLVAIFAIWFAMWARSASLQGDAIEAAKKVGGTIVFQHEYEQRSAGMKDITQPWLSNVLPDEFVFEVREVWVSAHLPDERLEELKAKLKKLPGETRIVPYFAH